MNTRPIDRIELNAALSYPAGGLTPSMELLEKVRAATLAPVRVMIRDRAGNFDYSLHETDLLAGQIRTLRPCLRPQTDDGFVFGCLTKRDGGLGIDVEACRRLVALASPVKCVFHRAFDQVASVENLRLLEELGFDAVLTAGGPEGGAQDNAERLAELVGAAREIKVVVAGGVRPTAEQAAAFARFRGRGDRVAFHSSCLLEGGNEGGGEGGDAEESQETVDVDLVEGMVQWMRNME
jgi:copper homeostasis protein